MDCLERIRQLLSERGWSVYRLAEKSGLPHSTLTNMFTRSNYPTVPTLEKLCMAFGISMREFFDEQTALPDEDKIDAEFMAAWSRLNKEQKCALLKLVRLL